MQSISRLSVIIFILVFNTGHRWFTCYQCPNLNLRKISESESDAHRIHTRSHCVIFVNATAIWKMGCVNVYDTVHMVWLWYCRHTCVCDIAYGMGFYTYSVGLWCAIPIYIPNYIHTQLQNVNKTHKIAQEISLKTQSHIALCERAFTQRRTHVSTYSI